jgi:hypothetical protein
VAGLIQAVSVDGLRVAEAELEPGQSAKALVAEARGLGAQLLWVHDDDDLEPLGFRAAGAYVRMHADRIPAGEPLPSLRAEDYASTLARAYAGLWGHKQVRPNAVPPKGAFVVGLSEDGQIVGLCRVFPKERLIDPGVVPEARTTERYARLLAAGCAALGPGGAAIDSWGDDDATIEAYRSFGFEVAEQIQGWELVLDRSSPNSRAI